MLRARQQQGATLIEALVALCIAAILVATAMPLYSEWIQNTQIRTGAEAMLNGLQLARSEALRRNASVQFEMTGQTGWKVNLATDPDGTPIQSRAPGSGSASANATPVPADATVVTFNAIGRRMASNPSIATGPIDRIDITSSTGMSGARNLRVSVSTGGQIRLCDPAAPTGDSRACLDGP